MKTHQESKQHGQGNSSADHERLKEKGISNAGGQRSDQTSTKSSVHKPERKLIRKALL